MMSERQLLLDGKQLLPVATSSNALLWDWTTIEKQTYEKRGYIKLTHEVYERQTEGITGMRTQRHEIVFIAGPPGVGKTGLAQTLKAKVAQDNGFFCQGKFDQPNLTMNAKSEIFSCRNSYEPFVCAINDLIMCIVNNGSGSIQKVQASIRQELDSSEIQALEESLPTLRRLTNNDCDGANSRLSMTTQRWNGLKGIDAEKRYMHILSKLLHAICSIEYPLVILLRDLQWADENALQLLKLLSTSKSTRFLIVCTVRAMEHDTQSEGQMSTLVSDLKDVGVGVTEIRMSNLSNKEIQELVSNTLMLPANEVGRFSEMLCTRTSGNLFFMKQFVAVLEGNGLLGFNSEMSEGFWDEERIRTTLSSHSTVADTLCSRILQLTEHEQGVLKTASCLGRNIHETLLEETVLPSTSVRPALLQANKMGLIAFDAKTRLGNFLHDHIQEAAYSLIPESDRARMHLNIGLRLWIWLPNENKDAHAFSIANQIIQGLHLLDDPIEKEDLARFMLHVGEKAYLVSSFSTAAAYFDVGIRLLRQRHWKHQYTLSLSLYTAAAEVEYYQGNLSRVDMLLEKIFKHAKTLDDKLRAHFTQIYSLGSRDDTKRALSEGLGLLKQLGEIFPIRPNRCHTAFALGRCKWMLHGMADDDIMNLPRMQCHRKLVIQRLMNTMYGFALTNCKLLVTLIVTRMVENTLRFGISAMSCLGFTLFGYLQGRRGNLEDEKRFGRLGWQMAETFQATEWLPRVTAVLVYNVSHSLRDQIKPLQSAHYAALVHGDVICRLSFYAADPLPDLANTIERYLSFCNQYKLTSAGVLLLHQLQACFNFMGRSADPVTLTSDLMDEVQTNSELQGRHPVAFTWLLLIKHMLSVYFHELELATELSKQIYKQLATMKTAFILPFAIDTHLFLDGLTAATLSRGDKQHVKRANKVLSQLQARKRFTGASYENKICLLEAELLAASGADHDVVLSKYQQSVEAAQREGFLQEQALAHEKAGRALLRLGDQQHAQDSFEAARLLYHQWGAVAKVRQINELIV